MGKFVGQFVNSNQQYSDCEMICLSKKNEETN